MMRPRSFFRNGLATDLILLLVFLTLAYIFMVRRGYMARVDSLILSHEQRDARDVTTGEHLLLPDKTGTLTREETTQSDIDLRVKRISDVRDKRCITSDVSAQIPCTIIIHFFDYSFHDMKFTLSSVLQFTPDSLIREIIIVDDGSTLQYIIEDAVTYVSRIPKAMLLRNEQQEGSAGVRMRAASKAMAANLIFLDPSVLVTPGWLSPLAHIIQKEQRIIAMPHMDRINDPVSYEYVKVDSGLIPTFNWNLDITVINRFDYNLQLDSFETSVVRGNVFAITKLYLEELHGLDTTLSEGGGDMLELSFRAAMCGGKIKMVPCSHVGVLNVREPIHVVSSKNIWYITELWLHPSKEHVYKHMSTDPASTITQADKQQLSSRRSQLSHLTCHDFSWYLKHVAINMYIPSSDVKQYGIVQIKNGRCMRVSRADYRVDLGSCTPEHVRYQPRDMIVELTSGGLLRSLGRCLAVQGSAYILAEECNTNNDHQVWTYDDKQRFVNKWSGYCIMHVTDPDPKLAKDKRQIAMAQQCSSDSTKDQLEFSSWKFLSVD